MEGDFRIDQWLIQPQLNSLFSPDNTTIQLEPKVMKVLVYLADRPGESVVNPSRKTGNIQQGRGRKRLRCRYRFRARQRYYLGLALMGRSLGVLH